MLHKMIMIFVKGSIYADILIFTEEIKWLWYLIKGSIYGDVFILIFTEYFCIKWLWYLSKDQYMEMCYFDIYRAEYFLHKMIMKFLKGSIYADLFILIFTEYFYIK